MALTTNEMTNFDELTIDKYVEGSYKAKRVLMTLAYIFVPLIFIVFLFAIGLGAIGLIIFIPLFYCWAFGKFVIPLTWRYVNISYTYIVKAGKFTMLTVYNAKGSKKAKNTFTPVTIDDMTAIKPFSDEFADALRSGKIDNFYSCCAYLDHPDNYYFTWVDENGKNCACVFQATNSTLKIMKFHNRGTVVTPVQCVSAEEGKHNPAKDGVRAIATAGIKEMSAKQLRSKNSITAICTSAGIVVVLVAVLVVNGIVSGKAVDKSGRAYVGSACLDNLGQTETTAAE